MTSLHQCLYYFAEILVKRMHALPDCGARVIISCGAISDVSQLSEPYAKSTIAVADGEQRLFAVHGMCCLRIVMSLVLSTRTHWLGRLRKEWCEIPFFPHCS